MISSDVLQKLSPIREEKLLLKRRQSAGDIIAAIMNKHAQTPADYDKFSDWFWTGDANSTCKKLFDFCKSDIRYKIEPDSRQTVRTPAVILGMRNGDCKHYASFINGVLDSLKRKGKPGIRPVYRFASYKIFDKTPHHVFAVNRIGNKEIWIDPVMRSYNYKKPYQFHVDKNPSILMSGIGALYSLSGTGNGIGRKKSPQRQKKKAARRTRRKARRANRPGLFKRVGMAPARGAYLLLLKMNIFHMASKIFKGISHNEANKKKLLDKWKKLGGQPAKLINAITHGVKVYNKHHRAKLSGAFNEYGWDASVSGVYVDKSIGVVPFAAAGAALAAASGIIVALKPILKSFGVDTEQLLKKGDKGAEQMYDDATQPKTQQDDDGGIEYSDKGSESDNTDEDLPEDDGSGEDPEASMLDPEELSEEGLDSVEGVFDFLKRDPKKVAFRKQKQAARKAARNAKRTKVIPLPVTPNGQVPNLQNLPPARKIKIVQRIVQPNKPTAVVTAKHDPNTGKKTLHIKHIAPGNKGGKVTDGSWLQDAWDKASDFVTGNKVAVGLGIAGIVGYKIWVNRKPKRRR